jgi:hexosaminidase
MPLPGKVAFGAGGFAFGAKTRITVDAGAGRTPMEIAEYLAELAGAAMGTSFKPEATSVAAEPGTVHLALDPAIADDEGYRLVVQNDRIELRAKAPAGLFYAVETLRQLFSASTADARGASKGLLIPAVRIEDAPRFRYRGLHLDTVRHFFSVDLVKRQIDLMASFKLNRFHWHLTDDQGWRIEIKKYPKLTEVGAWRKETLIGHEGDGAPKYDGQRHGGFYTQEEIKDVVAYAQRRFVTIVPEIEMPGHARAALASYPELACTKGPFEVATTWGVFDDIFCPTEKTFSFLEDVLTEVLALFPGQYVHLGGDEVPKVRWKKSPRAQEVKKREHLKNEEELQSYFVRRMGSFLAKQGRRMIGWDEILEGGLAKDATVMSWRGFEGGIEAAKQNHDAIMTPQDYAYFDSYQTRDIDQDPLAIGGYVPIEKVYAFDPVPETFTAEQGAHVLGGQGNVWTEYIATARHLDYMVFPRLLALAEVLWTPRERRSWDGFSQRLPDQLARLDQQGVTYSRHFFDPRQKSEVTKDGHCVVTLITNTPSEIRFTVDGSEPTAASPVYGEPIVLDRSATVKALSVLGENKTSAIVSASYVVSLATGKAVQYTQPFSEKYPAGRELALTDGLRGSANAGDGQWLGFDGKDLEATLDLGAPRPLKSVAIGFLRDAGDWIMLPSSVEFLVSDDGKSFRAVASVKNDANDKDTKPMVKSFAAKVDGKSGRYVRVRAKSSKLPAWHPGAGSPAWLFADELVVE